LNDKEAFYYQVVGSDAETMAFTDDFKTLVGMWGRGEIVTAFSRSVFVPGFSPFLLHTRFVVTIRPAV
jgi:hypothetical protein